MNIEITRSFSQKKNLGNYETLDSFSPPRLNVGRREVLDESTKRINKTLGWVKAIRTKD